MHSGSKFGLGYLCIQLSLSSENFKKIGGGKLRYSLLDWVSETHQRESRSAFCDKFCIAGSN